MSRWLGGVALLLGAMAIAGTPPVRAQEQPALPAGAQFLTTPEELPAGFLVRDVRHVAEHDGTIVVLGSTHIGARDLGVVSAAIRAPDGTWDTVTVDDLRGYRHPRGLAMSHGFLPAGLAAGPAGFLALGRAGFVEPCASSCAQDGQVQSLMWSSPDGRTWTRIDPRDILGSKRTAALQAVMATADGGWIVVGSSATTDFRHPSQIVVLTSPDGLEWRQAATIKGSRSLEATGVHQVGSTTVLEGVELVCDRASIHHSLAGAIANGDTISGRIAPLRLWQSDASARDWEPIDLHASGVIRSPGRGSFSRRDCATLDFQGQDRLDGSGSIVGAADGRLVAINDDRTRAAVTTDLEHWTVADLPDAVPGGDPPLDRLPVAAAVVADPTGLTLLSLERQRDPVTDAAIEYGDQQVLAWTTTDGGGTWSREPAARPLMVDAVSSLVQLPSGRVALTEGSGVVAASVRFSDAGPLAPWGACQPAAGADCAYATIDMDLAGADLQGINLDGVISGYNDWSGADLRGASMRGASLSATLTGADLRDADMVSASLGGDSSGARFDGADLRGARVPLDVLAGDMPGTRLAGASFQVPTTLPDGLTLSDRDLVDASFSGPYGGTGDLRGVDFGNAQIDGADFWYVDLTGAKLKAASFTTLTFSNVTCPDGKPMQANAYGLAACRIKAR